MGFESYHPAINLIYFVSVIAATIFCKQPIFLAVSYLCAFCYSIKKNGWKAVIFNCSLIPLIVVFALYYAGYHHFGITVMRQNFIGNNMTAESLLYGLTLGTVIAAVIMWLSCVFRVFTADKIVYLFGRISPKLSLFLSITLRMVPRFKAQAKKLHTARLGLGCGLGQGSILRQAGNLLKLFSMLVTWLLESMATISDSMRARGYALKGRTAFSIYRFDNRDRSFVIGIFTCLTVLFMGIFLGQTHITFDPRITMSPITSLSWCFYAGYFCLCLLPMVLELIGQWSFRRRRLQV